ncbi:MAG: hypothetical protein IPK39_05815 [Sulfuritalea sp.]|nr:hypothetical protein [Sulfuritalea sp.]
MIDGQDGRHRYEAKVGSGGVLATVTGIASALAKAINDNPGSGTHRFTATADGAIVVIVNAAGEGFQASFEIVTSATAPTASVEQIKGATAAAVLSGTLLSGDTWKFTVSATTTISGVSTVHSRTYEFVIGTADTLAQLAGKLATAINANRPLPGYFAAAVGSTVVVVDRAATPTVPAILLSIVLAPASASPGVGSSITVNRDATSMALTLGGTPVAGEQWYVRLGGVNYGFTVHEASAALADVALGLRDAFNALPGRYTVSVSGATLSIESTLANDPFRARITRSGAVQTFEASAATVGNKSLANVTLAGAPAQGEVWTLTLTNGNDQPVSVAFTFDTPTQIAAGIAAAVNASASTTAFAASSAGRTLIIIDNSGAAFPAGFAVQVAAPGAGVSTNSSVSALSANVALSGPVIEGEKWVLNLAFGPNPAGVTALTSVSYTVALVDADGNPATTGLRLPTLAEIAASLTALLNNPIDPVRAGLSAVANGSSLVLSSSALFKASVAVVPLGSASTTARDAATTGFALAGTPLDGDRWIVSVNGVQYSVIVDATSATLAKIGGALAKAINADAPGSFTAFFAGSTLYVTERTGAAFTSAAVVGLATQTAGAIASSASGSAVAITLSGDPVGNDTWRLKINGTINYTVRIGDLLVAGDQNVVVDTPEEIAQALTGKINAVLGNDIVATLAGNTIVLVGRSGVDFTATFEIELAGPPAGRIAGSAQVAVAVSATATLSGTPQPGETWKITANGITRSLAINSTTPETRQQVASNLAAQIDALADFVATVAPSGDAIVIVSVVVPAAPITLSTEVTRPGAVGTVSATTQNAKVLTLTGIPLNPSSWSITVDGQGVSVNVTDDTTTAADIAQAMAQLINTNLGATHAAVANGEQVTIARLDGAAPVVVVGAATTANGRTATASAVASLGAASDAWSLAFTGAPVAGEVWKLTFDAQIWSLTAVAGMSLADVVTGLAALADAAGGYSAMAEGTTLVVAKNGTAVLVAPKLSVAPTRFGQEWLATVTLSGTPAVGQTWKFKIGTQTAAYTVLAADIGSDGNAAALARIAGKLANFITDHNDIPVGEPGGFAGFSATASGARIQITGTTGAFTLAQDGGAGAYALDVAAPSVPFTTQTTLSGSVAAGDTWIVGLRTAGTPTPLQPTPPDVVANFNYFVGLFDADANPMTPARLPTLAEIAAGLAAAINANASGSFLAVGKGNDLVVINLAGAAFTTELRAPAGRGPVGFAQLRRPRAADCR